MKEDSLTLWETSSYQGHLQTTNNDEIAVEYALTVMINNTQYATIVCTPTDLKEMVLGFMAAEGLIRSVNEVDNISIDELKGFAYVTLTHAVTFSERTERWIGSCCGKSREFYLKQDVKTAKTVYSKMRIATSQIYALMEQFDRKAEVFERTGGVHQAALATPSEICESSIDIGRHNALDKVYGHILNKQIALKDKCVLFSGRISSEVVLKVSKMGAGILLAKSAPTDLALRLADDLHITTVGFIRDNSLNVYTHKERIYGHNEQTIQHTN